jgi:ribonuclease J
MRHMQEQGRLGKANGIPDQVVQQNGDVVRLAPGAPGKIAEVRSGRLVLDGDIIVPADGEAISMRRRIAYEGVMVVVLVRGERPLIEAIGLPLDEDMPEFLAETEEDILKAIGKLKGRDAQDPGAVHEAARLAARRAARRWAGKSPQVRVLMPGLVREERR